jgi:hypothetical protein
MAEEIEVDPMIAGATFFQTEYFTIEAPGSGQVVNRDSQVKRGQLHRICTSTGWALRPSLALCFLIERR